MNLNGKEMFIKQCYFYLFNWFFIYLFFVYFLLSLTEDPNFESSHLAMWVTRSNLLTFLYVPVHSFFYVGMRSLALCLLMRTWKA